MYSQEPSSCPIGNSGQTATNPIQASDNQGNHQDSQDNVWGMLVPFKQNKLETVHLIEDVVKFGRDPNKCQFLFDKRKHRLSKIEFQSISKDHFTIMRDEQDNVKIMDHSMNGTFVNNVRLLKNGQFPLQHNAVLSLGWPRTKYFIFLNRILIRRDQENTPRAFGFTYTLEDIVLGRGRFGTVKKGFINHSYNNKVAVKIITKDNSEDKRDTKYEFGILKGIAHQNIIQYYNYYENASVCFIVMEYVGGGDLCTFVQKHGAIGEASAKLWFRQIVEGVRFLHSNNIVHRDIKPENILLARDGTGAGAVDVMKITDFGLSRFVARNSVMNSYVGTSMYWAPEIPSGQGGYNREVDMWSLGCLLFVMLVGVAPFKPDTRVNTKVLNNLFVEDSWKKIPRHAQDLCSKMLKIVPSSRLGLSTALEHQWLSTTQSTGNNEASSERPSKRQKVQ